MKPILLCLHGWGGSKESFTELRAALKGIDIEILTPDLPGFGAEPEPARPWTTDDYTDWVVERFKARGPLMVLGHSHGGRIAVKLATRTSNTLPITHLFLCAPAGIRHPRHIKRIIGLTLAKTGKFFLSIPGLRFLEPLGKEFLYKLVRVHDYEKANPVMRETMINVSAEDLAPLIPKIAVPTDLFWGEDDRMTPVSDTLIFTNGITLAECRKHLFPGVRHAVHRDRAREIAEVIGKHC